jgi:hypothetical protein
MSENTQTERINLCAEYPQVAAAVLSTAIVEKITGFQLSIVDNLLKFGFENDCPYDQDKYTTSDIYNKLKDAKSTRERDDLRSTAVKVSVTKKDAKGKVIKVMDKTLDKEVPVMEMKFTSRKKLASFNSDAKRAFPYILAKLIHEAKLAEGKIENVASNETAIKNAIIEDCVENRKEYPAYISPLLFTITSDTAYHTDRMSEIMESKNLVNKSDTQIHGVIAKSLGPGLVQNVILKTFNRFLQLYSIIHTTTLWSEKKIKLDEGGNPYYVSVGKITNTGPLRNYLMMQSLMQKDPEHRLHGKFFDDAELFIKDFAIAEKERKSASKVKKEQNALEKKAKKDKATAEAEDTTDVPLETEDDPEPEVEVEPEAAQPKRTRRRAVR